MYEIYKLPQGRITIGISNKHLSVGILSLDPHQELLKHNRPVTEQLIQLGGSCVIKLFEKDKVVKEVTLNENETFNIPANQWHIHANFTDNSSVTMWKFEGDISEVIQKIRDNNVEIL